MTKPLIIITGSSSGIGAAMAKVFAEASYPLGLFARNKDAIEALGIPNSICLSVDVTIPDAMAEAVHQAESRFGHTGCLINNAGYAKLGDFCEIDHADHDKMVGVN